MERNNINIIQIIKKKKRKDSANVNTTHLTSLKLHSIIIVLYISPLCFYFYFTNFQRNTVDTLENTHKDFESPRLIWEKKRSFSLSFSFPFSSIFRGTATFRAIISTCGTCTNFRNVTVCYALTTGISGCKEDRCSRYSHGA